MRHITDAERRQRLATRHRLTANRRIDDVAAITDDLVALHSSDPTTVFLSAAARMANPTTGAIEEALYDTRTVLRHHAMRRTIWVMTPDTAQLAHASSTRKIKAAEVKKALGWLDAAPEVDDAEVFYTEATARIVDVVRSHAPITTRDVGKLVPEIAAISLRAGSGTRNEVKVSAHSRLLMLAAFDGTIVRTSPIGSWVSSQYQWAPIEDWHVTDLDSLDLDEASARLVDRYLQGFGPATETDIVWWTGWTKTQVRQALASIGAEQVMLDGGGVGWLSAEDDVTPTTAPWVAVLPGLDATTMGWKERTFYLDDALVPRLFDRFGNAGPTIWVDGRVVGGWAQRPDGVLATDFPTGFPDDRRGELGEELERIVDFVGSTRFRVRFPSPNQKDLLA